MTPQGATSIPTSDTAQIKTAEPKDIVRWLTLGWRDMRTAGFPSLLHGLIVAVISIAIEVATFAYWEVLPGAVTGFVLIGPFLATGLYALSCRIEKQRSIELRDAINAWRHGSRCLWVFGLLLVFATGGWIVFSVFMFHFFIDVEINQARDFFVYVLTQDDSSFMLWTILGALGAALAFAVTVVSLPLMVERDINTRDAIYVSLRAVGENPLVMVLWAMTIMAITGLSFITLMLGFILLYPLLGHASWHAYRDLVDPEGIKLRQEFPTNE